MAQRFDSIQRKIFTAFFVIYVAPTLALGTALVLNKHRVEGALQVLQAWWRS
jgi:hypothetical protein